MQEEFEKKSTEKERRWLLIERQSRQGDTTSSTISKNHLDLEEKGEIIKSQSEHLKTFFKDSAMLKLRFESFTRILAHLAVPD